MLILDVSNFSIASAIFVTVCPSGYSPTTLVSVKLHLVLICISLTTNDVENLSMRLLALCICSLVKYPFKSFICLLTGLLLFFTFES